jgi:hypothetical protein
MEATAAVSSLRNWFRKSSRMKILNSIDMRANDKPNAAAISTMPLWLVAVMIVRGGDCSGSSSVPFKAILNDLQRRSEL